MKEFKEFAVKGNMIDMAVGIIIGAAFGKIVASLVNDIVMPPLGLLIGGINFKDLKIVMSRAADGSAAATWNYGNFIQVAIEFLIIAFVIFMLIKAMSSMKKKEEATAPAAPPEPPKQEILLAEIRDLLKK